MRKELTAAQDKVKAMEHVVRSAERDVNVIRNEKIELSASLASNVGKLDKLLEHAKGMVRFRVRDRVGLRMMPVSTLVGQSGPPSG
jgi:hypothetical protein